LRGFGASSRTRWAVTQVRQRQIIMVVDDELDILDILTLLFEGEGYAVVAFSDARAALDYARLQPPALALVDLYMPLMNGRELILHLRRELGASFPIAVMSASSNHERVRDLPIQDYFNKPFDLEDVTERVRRLTDAPVPARRFDDRFDR
jgi:DNA-binding response OmpR family regulator